MPDLTKLFSSIPPIRQLKQSAQLDIEPGALIVQSRTVHVEQAREALNQCRGAGWLCLTDEVLLLKDGDPVPDDRMPLSAERFDGKTSVHLRQAGSQFLLSVFEREASDTHWIVTHRIVGRGPASDRRLKYEVAWAPTEGALSPARFRFVGFEGAPA